ncbi:MAG: hypothetical protein QM500_04695, partial [Methylococcales bacterium]
TARAVCNFASDVFLNVEFQKLSHVNEVFLRGMSNHINVADQTKQLDDLQSNCGKELSLLKDEFYKNLSTIPIDWEPEIFPANTPFTSYLKIKESISLVNERLHYFDRYLKLEFFETFLRNVDRSKEIRLITTAGKNDFGVKGVLSVSELARNEFQNYQLIEVSHKDIHDRNLRVDDSVFTLGPGLDRAGMCLTNFGPSDSSITALKHLDEIIGNGNVIHQS